MKKLSKKELSLISTILDRVADCMIKDDDFEFIDNGCFMLTLTVEEMKILNDVKDRLY